MTACDIAAITKPWEIQKVVCMHLKEKGLQFTTWLARKFVIQTNVQVLFFNLPLFKARNQLFP